MKSINKKFKITSGLFVLSTLLFAGCAMGGDLDSSSGTSGSSGTKHQWTTDSLEVTPNDAKYVYTENLLLSGDYTKADFVVNERDSYYISETHANWAGYGDRYNANVINQTTITVNGEEKADGNFTIESLKEYEIKFTYNNISKILTVKGTKIGSIIPSSEDSKEIQGVDYGEVHDGTTRAFKIVARQNRGFLDDFLYTESVQIKDATPENGYSIFIGESESSLTKYELLLDHTISTSDKIVKIYHENISSASDATTGAYTINLTVTPISDIKNANATFKSVTKGVEIPLLNVLTDKSLLTAYTSEDDVLTNCGQMKMADKAGDGTITVRDKFTLEIYDNPGFTGSPVAIIDKNTTAADKWTPGEGVVYPTYTSTYNNGVKTYIPVSPAKKVYYVKIIYDDGAEPFASNNIEQNYEGTSYKHYPMASVIQVTEN